jgi:nucleotide-binding universal stress UspA family protein
MKSYHILLPIEPEESNEGMIRSGISLASKLGAKLTFLYIINTSQYTAYAGSGAIMANSSITNLREQKEVIKTHYIKIMQKYKEDIPADVSIERSVLEGSWVQGIIGAIDQHKPDILMLMHAEQGFLEKVLGDTNTEILNQAKIPVWIIPEEGFENTPVKMAYMTDHRQGDIEALKQLHSISLMLDAGISLVHIIDHDDFDSQVRKEGFISMVTKEFSDIDIMHFEIKRGDIKEGVQELIRSENFDLVAMRNESENFLTRFFTRSSVEKLMESVDVPLSIYA